MPYELVLLILVEFKWDSCVEDDDVTLKAKPWSLLEVEELKVTPLRFSA